MLIEGLAHDVVDLFAGVVQLGSRPISGPASSHDKDAIAGIVFWLIVACSYKREFFARNVEFSQNGTLPHRVYEVLAGVTTGDFRADVTGCEQKTPFVRLDARNSFVCAYVVGDFEAARDGVVIVDEVMFGDQGVDVEIDVLFAAMPVERMKGEFHPLPRRKRKHVFRYIIPHAADLFLGDKQHVDGLVFAEFQGDFILAAELLSRVVQEAKQVHGTDAGIHDGSEIEAEQRAVLAPKVAVDLTVSIPEKGATAIIRIPSAEHDGQWQPRRAPAHDDDGMVFGCGHDISGGPPVAQLAQ